MSEPTTEPEPRSRLPFTSSRSRRELGVGCLAAASVPFWCAVLGLLLCAILPSGVRVRVDNEVSPPRPLTDVTVAVRGEAIPLEGSLAPGEHRSVKLHRIGKSDVTLTFAVDGHRHRAQDGYIEGDGVSVDLSVREQGTVFMTESDWPLHGSTDPYKMAETDADP
jgi:hypothetical protein